jgi:hypothetical protein
VEFSAVAHPADFIPEIDRVLAAIKTPGTDKAQVRELQREYRKLSRQYERAARAHAASIPTGPLA